MRNTVILPLALFSLILLISCRKKDDVPYVPTGPVTQQEINGWVLDSMRYFYLWNDQLPGQPDKNQETQVFFNGLKNREDLFSFIYNPSDPQTITYDMLNKYGVDYTIVNWPPTGGVIGVVKLVVPGSYAAAGGLKRGDYFTRINETVLTADNAVRLSDEMLKAEISTLTPAILTNGSFVEQPLVQLQRQRQTASPLYTTKVFNSGAVKVGYLFYNAFNDGYNNYVLAAFEDFKRKGVQELIIDLRYNAGGSLAGAAMMAAMIAPGVKEGSPFVKYTGNSRFPTRTLSFATTLSVPETGDPISFNSLSGGRLNLSRVFILSGRQTVSAAELLINNLKPYTTVIQIGATTWGKDKGAVIISDMRNTKRISWIMHPLTYRLANANGEGGYTQGITPQYKLDELSVLPLAALGDTRDPLLAKALSLIDGNGRVSNENIPAAVRSSIYDSRDKAAVNSIMILPK
ncbi:hypothetical protein KTO58_21350 [Chitinophaga pendula]|uniref:S41 family peptidase n=1 Tax=Chitinophaga TaxID=79328 RepID=UPI000BAEC8B5|nr:MULTISPECIES: S41 family peptidase [Chitinophaga]ASZ10824.1 hypothetical protein CK934_07455 [Chitinophaga sp. MD30]UCJ06196.1 hypothetical protein KTO58_21350 [Chitinophaga pendula]